MATPLKTSGSTSHRSSIRRQYRKQLHACSDRHPETVWPRTKISTSNAADAVGFAFARVMAERYPGTIWLPVKPGRSDDGLIVPAGKVVRLLPGPADMDAGGGIGYLSAPSAH
jgi:hypothetical protein